MTYTVPEQNLSIRMSGIPAIPKSRFQIENVQIKRDPVPPSS